MRIVGVDPGKKGYECMLGVGETPSFWPSPLTRKVDAHGEAVHDPEGDYDLSLMCNFARTWREGKGVCLVVLEKQAPQGRPGQKEGTVVSWVNGYGFGLWEMSLVAAGFTRAEEVDVCRAVESFGAEALAPSYVVSDPLVWKRRMGAIASHRGEDSRGARKRANDLRTIEVARRVDPTLDFFPVERGGGTKRADSPDKAASYLLATYGLRWILEGGKVKT